MKKIRDTLIRDMPIFVLEYKKVMRAQTLQLVSGGLSFKNLNGDQAIKEFKRIMNNEEGRFTAIQDAYLAEINKKADPAILDRLVFEGPDVKLGKREASENPEDGLRNSVMQIGLKRVKVEGDGESAVVKQEAQVVVAAQEEVKAAQEEKMEDDDDEPFQFDPALFPILADDELENLIAEWKNTNPLWTISVPSLRPSSVDCEEEQQ